MESAKAVDILNWVKSKIDWISQESEEPAKSEIELLGKQVEMAIFLLMPMKELGE